MRGVINAMANLFDWPLRVALLARSVLSVFSDAQTLNAAAGDVGIRCVGVRYVGGRCVGVRTVGAPNNGLSPDDAVSSITPRAPYDRITPDSRVRGRTG